MFACVAAYDKKRTEMSLLKRFSREFLLRCFSKIRPHVPALVKVNNINEPLRHGSHNQQPACLYYPARCHIRAGCIDRKTYPIIRRLFCTCGPRTGPQYRAWPCVLHENANRFLFASRVKHAAYFTE